MSEGEEAGTGGRKEQREAKKDRDDVKDEREVEDWIGMELDGLYWSVWIRNLNGF